MDKAQYQNYRENKKHTPDYFPYNTYLCTIPLDFGSVKLHWHDETELIIIKKGEGKVSVDLTEYCVKAGDIVFVPSGKLHSIEQKESMIMEYENIIFKSSLLRSTDTDDYCFKSFIEPICGGELTTASLIDETLTCHSELSSLISYMDKLCDEKGFGYQLGVKGCLYQVIYLLLTEGERKTAAGASKKSLEKLKIILAYIEKNYQKQISIEEAASCCYYSKSYFMRFFKETVGMSFVEYLNNYRLDIAAKKLKETGDNILNIAIDCGFENLSYFNRKFKQRFNVTPGKYRSILPYAYK